MPAATWYQEISFEVVSFPGPLFPTDAAFFLRVRDTGNGNMGLISIKPPDVVNELVGDWYPAPQPGVAPFGVEHVFTQAHTPLAESAAIDGFPLTFDPLALGGYVPFMAGKQGRFFRFGIFYGSFGGNVTEGWLDTWKIGTAPGLSDILNYNAATDGLGPFTVPFGSATPSGGRLHFDPGSGGIVQFDFTAPWPPPVPTFTFLCSFSVGVTNVMRMTPNLPPPNDKVLVQAALPETLLPEGYRIEVGVYNPDGTPFMASTERDTTLAFTGLDDEDDETF